MSDCVCGNRVSGTPASRREFLARCGMGLGALGLTSLLAEEMLALLLTNEAAFVN